MPKVVSKWFDDNTMSWEYEFEYDSDEQVRMIKRRAAQLILRFKDNLDVLDAIGDLGIVSEMHTENLYSNHVSLGEYLQRAAEFWSDTESLAEDLEVLDEEFFEATIARMEAGRQARMAWAQRQIDTR